LINVRIRAPIGYKNDTVGRFGYLPELIRYVNCEFIRLKITEYVSKYTLIISIPPSL